jgi:hypothetical protein
VRKSKKIGGLKKQNPTRQRWVEKDKQMLTQTSMPGVLTLDQVDFFDRTRKAILTERAVKAHEIKAKRDRRAIKLRGIHPVLRPFIAPFIKG